MKLYTNSELLTLFERHIAQMPTPEEPQRLYAPIKYGLEITNEQYPLVAASKNKEDTTKTSDESSAANDDQKGNETGNDQNSTPDGNKA
jgi:hypothetical protein